MRAGLSLCGLLATTSAAAGPFECTLDGAPWKTKPPLVFVSSVEGRPRLSVQVNQNRAPGLSLSADWEPLKGPGKAAVELSASDGGPPALAGTFWERYEKPIPHPDA